MKPECSQIGMECWEDMMNWGMCFVEDLQTSWEDMMNWGVRKLKSRMMKAVLCRLG